MSQSLSKIYIHMTFSTCYREPILPKEHLGEIFSYIGGTLNHLGCKCGIVGGMPDHIHVLYELSKNMSVSQLAKEIKGQSSKWIKEQYAQCRGFSWQSGFAAFSVSQSNIDKTFRYIANQETHHKKVSFQDELRQFLQAYNIEYDEQYIWT